MARDFIDTFMQYTEGSASPRLFRLWGAIAAISGALERRVWVDSSQGPKFPNCYVMLVAPPAVGKGVIDLVEDLWAHTKGLHVAPDSMTSASMNDVLKNSNRVIIDHTSGRLLTEYSALAVAAEEFSVFCPAYDTEFLSRLTKIWNNVPQLKISRKYLKEEVIIKRPCMTILTGVQPGVLKMLFPEEAWSGGFTSRLIMVYCGEGLIVDVFAQQDAREELREELLKHLASLSKLYGKFFIESDAGRRINDWWKSGAAPKPLHSKLSYYSARRILHVLKLVMISSASRGTSMCINMADVDRVFEWLFEAEASMPDIFRAMVGRSDGEVIRELHYFMWAIWVRRKEPIARSVLINFLADRVPQEKILRIIEIAELGKKIKQVGPQMYEPIPLTANVE